jgi:hypothetical protein
MKRIDVNGRTIEYEVFYDCSEYGDTYETVFYEGKQTVSRKKYFLFGETVSKEFPREIFRIYFNVEDEGRTKSEIRAIIERRLELLDRKEQIRRGELI